MALVDSLNKRISRQQQSGKRAETTAGRIAGAALFLVIFLLSALAVAALAVAAPVVLALSAIAGLVAGKKHNSGWRPAGA